MSINSSYFIQSLETHILRDAIFLVIFQALQKALPRKALRLRTLAFLPIPAKISCHVLKTLVGGAPEAKVVINRQRPLLMNRPKLYGTGTAGTAESGLTLQA